MNKVALIITSLVLATVVVLSGCGTIKLPDAGVPAPVAPTPLESAPALGFTEVPTEGHIGDWITVKARVPEDDLYHLVLRRWEENVGHEYVLGSISPDDQLICTWYVQLPSKTDLGDPFPAGSCEIAVASNNPNEPWFIIRNIIIKE